MGNNILFIFLLQKRRDIGATDQQNSLKSHPISSQNGTAEEKSPSAPFSGEQNGSVTAGNSLNGAAGQTKAVESLVEMAANLKGVLLNGGVEGEEGTGSCDTGLCLLPGQAMLVFLDSVCFRVRLCLRFRALPVSGSGYACVSGLCLLPGQAKLVCPDSVSFQVRLCLCFRALPASTSVHALFPVPACFHVSVCFVSGLCLHPFLCMLVFPGSACFRVRLYLCFRALPASGSGYTCVSGLCLLPGQSKLVCSDSVSFQVRLCLCFWTLPAFKSGYACVSGLCMLSRACFVSGLCLHPFLRPNPKKNMVYGTLCRS
jgi:hypothetical protein